MIKHLEIKPFMQSNAAFADNTISSCFFFFFLIFNLYFLILAIIAQIFNYIVELKILVGISTRKAKAEMEIHSVTEKT